MKMKNLLSTVIGISMLSAASAQITVNATDLVFPVGNDTAYYKVIDTATLGIVPQSGNNVLWNYAAVATTDSSYIRFDNSNRLHTFSSSTAMDNAPLPYGTYALENTTYYTQNADGFYTSGYFIPAQGFRIGNASDTLIFTGDTISLATDFPVINFPVTHNGSHQTSTSFKINFRITYAPLLNNAPGYLKRHVSTNALVSGWGKLVYPGSRDTIDVIRIQKTVTFRDSIYANNFPLPQSVLSGTGFEQGQETHTSTVELVAVGLKIPAMTIYTNLGFDRYISGFYNYSRQGDVNVGIKDIIKHKINIYPNPASDIVNIDIRDTDVTFKSFVAEIYALDGRKVEERAVKNNMLPVAGLAANTYIVRILSANKFIGYFKLVKQ